MGVLKKSLVFVLVIALSIFVIVFGDENEKTWNCYGLYNISNQPVKLDSANTTTIIDGINIVNTTEYILKNEANTDIDVVFGIPNNGDDLLTATDNGNKPAIQYWSKGAIAKRFTLDSNLLIQDSWFLVKIQMKAGEQHSLKIIATAAATRVNNTVTVFNYSVDQASPYFMKTDKNYIKFNVLAYKPYQILKITDSNNSKIDNNGQLSIEKLAAGEDAKIYYQPVDRMILSPLILSEYLKPKAIAKAYTNGSYNEAIKLCNEYLAYPQDKKLTTAQVKLVKAECLRLLKNDNDFLAIINEIENSQLYPERVILKLGYEKINIYNEQGKATEAAQTVEKIKSGLNNNEINYMSWLNANVIDNSTQPKVEAKTKQVEKSQPTVPKVKKPNKVALFFSDVWKTKMTILKKINFIWVAIFVVGFALGYLAGRGKRRRKRSSEYLYRS